jgi:hypothetical protein
VDTVHLDFSTVYNVIRGLPQALKTPALEGEKNYHAAFI